MSKDIILKFVNAIDHQDLPMIIEMMADEFSFIDTYGDAADKEHMKEGWQGYFDWFPDYRIEVEEYITNGHFSMILGKASGSYLGDPHKYWQFPAAWKVVVKGEQILTWQVYCDSKKQLDSMNGS